MLATIEGTKKFAERFPKTAPGHFRTAQGLTVSSIGIGTYLGNWDAITDENYVNSIVKFVESGGNVIDTAANYRFQRSERNIGEALKILAEKGFGREDRSAGACQARPPVGARRRARDYSSRPAGAIDQGFAQRA